MESYPHERGTFDEHAHRAPADWARVFLDMAHDIKERSKDPSTQCGAVLVGKNRRILSAGFNGPPEAIIDSLVPWDVRPDKYAYIIHAEENALWTAAERGLDSIKGATMYTTHMPCSECVLRMILTGVRRVVTPECQKPYPLSKYQVDPQSIVDRQRFPKLDITRVPYEPRPNRTDSTPEAGAIGPD